MCRAIKLWIATFGDWAIYFSARFWQTQKDKCAVHPFKEGQLNHLKTV